MSRAGRSAPRAEEVVPPREITAMDRLVPAAIHAWCGQLDDPARGYPCACLRPGGPMTTAKLVPPPPARRTVEVPPTPAELTERREARLRLMDGYSVPTPWCWPKRMQELVTAVRAAGWRYLVSYGTDNGGNPFLTVQAAEDGDLGKKINTTWHTRATNGRTYRLFSAMACRPYQGWHDVTVKRLLGMLEEGR